MCVLHVATFQVCALDSKHSSRMTVPIHPAYQPAAQKQWVTEWAQRKRQGVQGTARAKPPRARSDLQGGGEVLPALVMWSLRVESGPGRRSGALSKQLFREGKSQQCTLLVFIPRGLVSAPVINSFILAPPCGMQDLSSLTRDRIHVPCTASLNLKEWMVQWWTLLGDPRGAR